MPASFKSIRHSASPTIHFTDCSLVLCTVMRSCLWTGIGQELSCCDGTVLWSYCITTLFSLLFFFLFFSFVVFLFICLSAIHFFYKMIWFAPITICFVFGEFFFFSACDSLLLFFFFSPALQVFLQGGRKWRGLLFEFLLTQFRKHRPSCLCVSFSFLIFFIILNSFWPFGLW